MSLGDAIVQILLWTAVFGGAAAAILQLRAWRWARERGLEVSATEVLALRLRGTPPLVVLEPMARAHAAGLDLDLYAVEARWLAGDDVDAWLDDLIERRGVSPTSTHLSTARERAVGA